MAAQAGNVSSQQQTVAVEKNRGEEQQKEKPISEQELLATRVIRALIDRGCFSFSSFSTNEELFTYYMEETMWAFKTFADLGVPLNIKPYVEGVCQAVAKHVPEEEVSPADVKLFVASCGYKAMELWKTQLPDGKFLRAGFLVTDPNYEKRP